VIFLAIDLKMRSRAALRDEDEFHRQNTKALARKSFLPSPGKGLSRHFLKLGHCKLFTRNRIYN
jgi:hypothetical protein